MLLYFSMFSYEYVTPALDINRPEEKSMVIQFAERRSKFHHKSKEKQQSNDRSKKEGENENDAKLENLQGIWQSFGMNVGEICFLVEEDGNIKSFLRKNMSSKTYMDVLNPTTGKKYEASWKIDEKNTVTIFFSILNE